MIDKSEMEQKSIVVKIEWLPIIMKVKNDVTFPHRELPQLREDVIIAALHSHFYDGECSFNFTVSEVEEKKDEN